MQTITMLREDALKLIGLARNSVGKGDLSKYIDLSGYAEHAESYRTEFESDFIGVSNGFLSEVVHAITGFRVVVCGEVEDLFQCPCCGYRTLTERYNSIEGTGYDICPYCNWEDDGTTDIYSRRSINGGSIQDYRDKMQANPNRYYINKWIKE
jgi:hypothetical protein